ncbi:MAG: energy-coupling factor transporter ATPase [Lachnospiraceae bacterium]|nr:energy-coupling factor transporter ATPase [Lachnospiraceae bacterium]
MKGISLERVSYQYQTNTSAGGKTALHNVTLHISPGEFIALIGKTGSGKSTLIQHLNGLLRPTEGNCFFDGENIWEKNFDKKVLRQKVGLCFQYPEYQLFEETVLKDIAFGPQNLGFGKIESEAKARHAMEVMGLDEKLEGVSPFSLSGGQKRRVALAGVLAMEPEYLILDEPLAGLDYPGKEKLFEILHFLNEKKGISIVIVSHNMSEAAAHAKRVIAMENGSVRMDGKPEEIFVKKDELKKMGLDVPDVVRFYMDVRERFNLSTALKEDSVPLTQRQLAKWLCKILEENKNGRNSG